MASRFNLVCIDDSDHSRNAFDWYLMNHHRPEDVIGLVFAHRMPVLPISNFVEGNIVDPQIMDDYRQKVNATTAEVKKIQTNYENLCKEKNLQSKSLVSISQHSAGRTICTLAKENSADAIFMGQRGLGTISRSVLGSTSDYVLHHADVTVVVVPTKTKK